MNHASAPPKPSTHLGVIPWGVIISAVGSLGAALIPGLLSKSGGGESGTGDGEQISQMWQVVQNQNRQLMLVATAQQKQINMLKWAAVGVIGVIAVTMIVKK